LIEKSRKVRDMPRQYYKRGWTHTKTRGKESMVTCGFCGRRVPKYKTFPTFKGFGISDPAIKAEIGIRGRRGMNLLSAKVYACPGCARHRNIVRKKR
jgi:ribosomal protein S26